MCQCVQSDALCAQMAEEELYDSLDESSPGLRRDIATLIPLYAGETLKDSIKPPKKNKAPGFARNNRTTVMRLQNKKFPPPAIAYNKREESYTMMFHRKMGRDNRGTSETARAQCGGDFTHRTDDSSLSVATHYSGAQSCTSDSASFYHKLIGNSAKLPGDQSSNTDMRSISQYSVNNIHKSNNKKGAKKVTTPPVPVLGGLGPDTASNQEKLNRLRRQTSYGQKASRQNRIKMMEVKVLRDLKKEMKNSN